MRGGERRRGGSLARHPDGEASESVDSVSLCVARENRHRGTIYPDHLLAGLEDVRKGGV